jgi:hypothetical protein
LVRAAEVALCVADHQKILVAVQDETSIVWSVAIPEIPLILLRSELPQPDKRASNVVLRQERIALPKVGRSENTVSNPGDVHVAAFIDHNAVRLVMHGRPPLLSPDFLALWGNPHRPAVLYSPWSTVRPCVPNDGKVPLTIDGKGVWKPTYISNPAGVGILL